MYLGDGENMNKQNLVIDVSLLAVIGLLCGYMAYVLTSDVISSSSILGVLQLASFSIMVICTACIFVLVSYYFSNKEANENE